VLLKAVDSAISLLDTNFKNMNIYNTIIKEIKAATNIIITAHRSPDGDSVGSSLGLHHFIRKMGKNVTVCHPDPAPDYLSWLEDVSSIRTMTNDPLEIETLFEKADLVFCLDYNASDRVGEGMQKLLEGSQGKKIMIDHHLHPQDFADITVSDANVCSTCQLIVELIDQSGNGGLLDEKCGTPLYLGILTDTGSFRFPSVQPRTHEIISKLLNAGVKHHLVHEALNDNNTQDRLRLQGFALSQKLEVIERYQVAIISLTEKEMKEYNYIKGDTEGLVNIGLSIKGMKASFFLGEKEGAIKISFRSKGENNPVNILASQHFEGGGHANAAGGISHDSMEVTISKLKEVIPLFFA
jgi:bifunctional oligoribonuclease and PAP phosphatase NrnA